MDNPQAFPMQGIYTHQEGTICEGQEGMTLRDYFAAKALVCLDATMYVHDGFLVQRAYHIADAMLEERSKA